MSDYSNGDRPMNGEEMEDFLRNSFDSEFPHVNLSAFANNISEFELVNMGHIDIEEFLKNAYKKYEVEIVKAVKKFKMIKSLSYFCAEFERATAEEQQSDPLFENTRLPHFSCVKIIERKKKICSSVVAD